MTAKETTSNRGHSSSLLTKSVFFFLHSLIFSFSLWLILWNGVGLLGSFWGQSWEIADPMRAKVLLACTFLYWARHAVTLFYLVVRKIPWGEAIGLSFFFAFFEITLLLAGGGILRDSPTPMRYWDIIALILLLTGSFLNSGSEIQRKWWKKNPVNKGHCYTLGLFRHSMHINYFGDLVLFSGWCIFTCSLVTFAIPLLMLIMFVFLHIPDIDLYLAKRYGEEFEAYAQRTKKLIPGIF
ncbi:MAG: DUF1295 domain-containing protein [Kofleriaceae bacterium]|nr:DUF1295 domain-containing protein [Kofleriaceae bacterium]